MISSDLAPMWQNAEQTQSALYINHYSEFGPDAVFFTCLEGHLSDTEMNKLSQH
jgi:hypothetical protein